MDASIRERELSTFLSFVMGADRDRDLAERTYHVMREFGFDDFRALSDVLVDADSSAGFAVLGRDAHDQAAAIEHLDSTGHEIVFHGHRHTSFASMSYEDAEENLTTGMNALERETGILPRGFFAPFKVVSSGTLDAAVDLGFEWILGRTDAPVPDSIELVESVYPHDSVLLKAGRTPAEVFDEFEEQASDDVVFLFHPNLLEFHDARDELKSWIQSVHPVTVKTMLRDGGVGTIFDCLQPIRFA